MRDLLLLVETAGLFFLLGRMSVKSKVKFKVPEIKQKPKIKAGAENITVDKVRELRAGRVQKEVDNKMKDLLSKLMSK